MPRRALACFAILVLGFANAAPGRAQEAPIADKVGQGAVTIVTDGISDPKGRLTPAIGELAARLSEIGKLRVLPLMGYGGAGNVRDLLHLQGVDVALLNSDILAFLDQTGEYRSARRKIRYVTHLADQNVYLIGRKPIASMKQLAGRKIAVFGADGAGLVTATALFGLAGIKVEIKAVDGEPALDAAPLDGAGAVLVVDRDLSRLRRGPAEARAWTLLPVPAAGKITSVYRPAEIAQSDAPDLAAAPVASVKLATVLAVFDWKSGGARYQNVTNFIRALFGALGDLKRGAPGGVWPETDIEASIPDWERYGPAEALRKTVPPADAAVAARTAPPAARTAPPAARPPATDAAPIRLVAANRPPLSDPRSPDGGLVAELTAASLRVSGEGGAAAPFAAVLVSEDARDDPVAALADRLADAAAPVETPDCDHPGDLGYRSAAICDRALISDALFSVVTGFFTRADSDFAFEADDSVAGRTVCLPEALDTSDLNSGGRDWLADKKITLLRPATLVECLSLVQNREADAVLANELEGSRAIERLGLSPDFRMAERPVATHGLHVIVLKEHEKGAEMIAAINRGIPRLKQDGAYAAIVAKHLPAAGWPSSGGP